MIDSLCILGGGTSGLVSALMLKKAWPALNVTIIESSKIGIIGVGEGSTEHWKKFMEQIGINVPELIRETGATYKIGIKFTNWHGDNTHYFHSLAEQFGSHSDANGLPYTWLRMIAENFDPNDTAWKISMESRHVEPLHDILSQYHFDTVKLNKYLHRLCSERSIKVVDTEIQDVILDDQGYVAELVDVNNQSHKYDFYIDCSGFKRVIGSKLGAKWNSCEEQLPMNSAIAFPTGYTEDIPSYTEATALGSGWAWRIPTQDRYGNGYVYCDQFVTDTAAYDEVSHHYRNNLGIHDEIQVGRKIKFNAGYVDKFWIKNCVMVGLSGIFVEPLEASSIGTTIQQCFLLIPALFFYERGNTLTVQKYNQNMEDISKNIVDFIQLHYFSERDDTEFWKWCKHNIKLTDFNAETLEFFKSNTPHPHYFTAPLILFSHLNFMQVMHGLRLFDHKKIHDAYAKHLDQYTIMSKQVLDENDAYSAIVPTVSHRVAINTIKERYLNVQHTF